MTPLGMLLVGPGGASSLGPFSWHLFSWVGQWCVQQQKLSSCFQTFQSGFKSFPYSSESPPCGVPALATLSQRNQGSQHHRKHRGNTHSRLISEQGLALGDMGSVSKHFP